MARLVTVPAFVLAGLLNASCYGNAQEEEEFGSVAQAQIEAGSTVQRALTLKFTNGAELGQIFLFNQSIGSFTKGTEYFYINQDNLGSLGSLGITITIVDSNSLTPPTPPSYTHRQSFTLPGSPSWGNCWTSDPLSGGSLYSDGAGQGLRIKTSGASPNTINNISWYQVISSGSTPANITPSSSFSVATSITVPTGKCGYDISQTP